MSADLRAADSDSTSPTSTSVLRRVLHLISKTLPGQTQCETATAADPRKLEVSSIVRMPPIAVDLSSYIHKRPLPYLIKRGLWACVQLPFVHGMPKKLSGFRIALLRLFGARIGKGCLICGGVQVWEPWNFQIGDRSVIGTGAEIYNLAKITIGSNAVISQDAYLCSASHDYTNPTFPLFSKPITVGDGAWIASKTFIGPGVNVGEGAVVGACSVVTKDMPEWTVCAGNPCRPIKRREMRSSAEEQP